MHRTNYTPPRKPRPLEDFAATVLAVVLIAFLLSHVGPARDGIIEEIEAERAIQAQLERDARYAAAAQEQCGGLWSDAGPGIVNCLDERGRVTRRNYKVAQ